MGGLDWVTQNGPMDNSGRVPRGDCAYAFYRRSHHRRNEIVNNTSNAIVCVKRVYCIYRPLRSTWIYYSAFAKGGGVLL